MPSIHAVTRPRTTQDIYSHLKTLEKVKGGSFALAILYAICRESYFRDIDAFTRSLFERHKIKVIEREAGWSVEHRLVIRSWLFRNGNAITVMMSQYYQRRRHYNPGF